MGIFYNPEAKQWQRRSGTNEGNNKRRENSDRENKMVPIVGVLKDFHTKSTHQPIGALAYSSVSRNSYTIHVALRPQDGKPGLWKIAIDKIGAEFKKTFPETFFIFCIGK